MHNHLCRFLIQPETNKLISYIDYSELESGCQTKEFLIEFEFAINFQECI